MLLFQVVVVRLASMVWELGVLVQGVAVFPMVDMLVVVLLVVAVRDHVQC